MYRRVAARRPSTNAIHSGTAVSASERLCTVSARRATDPLTATMASCASAVSPRTTRETFTARTPWPLATSSSSIESAASWECGTNTSCSQPRGPVGCS
ncbi:Hypothetical protein ERS075557_08724 [Mycobacteroides abscessus]|nr:Hypothetical protein ERS075557_08724 [Mycobacteroides abscessus]